MKIELRENDEFKVELWVDGKLIRESSEFMALYDEVETHYAQTKSQMRKIFEDYRETYREAMKRHGA